MGRGPPICKIRSTRLICDTEDSFAAQITGARRNVMWQPIGDVVPDERCLCVFHKPTGSAGSPVCDSSRLITHLFQRNHPLNLLPSAGQFFFDDSAVPCS
eukprot:COSAG02_NODE_2113_length_9800_cov_53.566643_9_plen_100_part_00